MPDFPFILSLGAQLALGFLITLQANTQRQQNNLPNPGGLLISAVLRLQVVAQQLDSRNSRGADAAGSYGKGCLSGGCCFLPIPANSARLPGHKVWICLGYERMHTLDTFCSLELMLASLAQQGCESDDTCVQLDAYWYA